MSTTLGAAKAFTYRSTSIQEVPAKTGQFVTLFSTVEVALKRPNKLRARLTGEAPHFDSYFDGATASAFAPATKVYSTLEAPSTIDTMLPALQQETGIRFASVPLLFSDPYGVLTRELSSGVVVGAAVVNGRPCQHLAFRSPGVNWEIWIESGPRALPPGHKPPQVTMPARVFFGSKKIFARGPAGSNCRPGSEPISMRSGMRMSSLTV